MLYIKLILLVLGLMLLAGTASATDYYIDANTGNDGDDGQSLANAWLTLAHADGQLSAGDTLYFVDGTWSDEHFVLTTSGTSGNPITLTAYNGTPTLDGVDRTGYGIDLTGRSYIDITGNILITRYHYGVNKGTSHINFEDFTINDTTNTGMYLRGPNDNITIDNVTITHTGVGSAIITHNPTSAASSTDITIKNSVFLDNNHDAINIFGWNTNVLIENNSITDATNSAGVMVHNNDNENITVRNNTFENCTRGIQFSGVNNSIIENNTIYNSSASYGIEILEGVGIGQIDNITIKNNIIKWSSIYDIYVVMLDDVNDIISNITLDNNSVTEPIKFFGENISNVIIRDIPDSTQTIIIEDIVSNLDIEFTDGKVFTEDSADVPYWYPDRSNISLTGTGTISISTYNMTFIPSTGYGKDIVVNTNMVNDVSNISANVSEAAIATMTFLVDNVTNTYNLSVDDIFNTSVVSDSDSIVEFNYSFPSPTLTDFEVTWASTEGWAPIPNTQYLNRNCRWYTNGSMECFNVEYGDTAIPTFKVVVS